MTTTRLLAALAMHIRASTALRSPMETLARVLGAPWLGHGRMFEFVAGTICALYGLVLLFHPDALWDSQATRDLSWYVYGRAIAAPFLLTATFTGYGLAANIFGWP